MNWRAGKIGVSAPSGVILKMVPQLKRQALLSL
jgi:hypothetical protein